MNKVNQQLTFLLILSITSSTTAFSIIHKLCLNTDHNSKRNYMTNKISQLQRCSKPSIELLSLYSTSLTNPSQEKSVELGIREWPQQTKSQSSWSEEVNDGETRIRYILQGSGDLIVDSEKPKKFGPGVLVEVTGPASLNWEKSSTDDVIILTPGYEQGGQLIGVGLAFIVLCGALIAGVGN